jgi:hypothetical protein
LESERNQKQPPGTQLDIAEVGDPTSSHYRYGQCDEQNDGQP